MYCFLPVLERYWKQYELYDGTYNLYDLIDIHKAIEARSINEAKVQKFYEDKRKRQEDLNKLMRGFNG